MPLVLIAIVALLVAAFAFAAGHLTGPRDDAIVRLRRMGYPRMAGGAPVAPVTHGLNYYAGRVAAIVGSAATIALAVAPAVTDADWQTSAGFLTGALSVGAIVLKFMHGAQKHEDREAIATLPFGEGNVE
jgi:hypothetical protein